ncbi:MAG: hypothetical protein JNJ41_12920 [Bacteroidia bacterium]|nr:hypothetical protein [Bacteroidia bacterium]
MNNFDGYTGNSFVIFELCLKTEKTKLKFTPASIESFALSKNPDLAAKNFPDACYHSIGIALREIVK